MDVTLLVHGRPGRVHKLLTFRRDAEHRARAHTIPVNNYSPNRLQTRCTNKMPRTTKGSMRSAAQARRSASPMHAIHSTSAQRLPLAETWKVPNRHQLPQPPTGEPCNPASACCAACLTALLRFAAGQWVSSLLGLGRQSACARETDAGYSRQAPIARRLPRLRLACKAPGLPQSFEAGSASRCGPDGP